MWFSPNVIVPPIQLFAAVSVPQAGTAVERCVSAAGEGENGRKSSVSSTGFIFCLPLKQRMGHSLCQEYPTLAESRSMDLLMGINPQVVPERSSPGRRFESVSGPLETVPESAKVQRERSGSTPRAEFSAADGRPPTGEPPSALKQNIDGFVLHRMRLFYRTDLTAGLDTAAA